MEILAKHLTEIREVETLDNLRLVVDRGDLDIACHVFQYPNRNVQFYRKANIHPVGMSVKTGSSSLTLPSVTLVYARDIVVMGKNGVVQHKNMQTAGMLFPFINSERLFDPALFVEAGMKLKLQESNLQSTGPGKLQLITPLNIVREIKEPVFVFGTPRDAAYSHFVWDSLPQIWYLQQLNDPAIKILVEEELASYKYEFLESVGFDRSRIITRKRDEHVLCERAYMGSVLGFNNKWISSQGLSVLQSLRESGSMHTRRIFLDRNDERKNIRRLLNEEKIWSLCEQKGFERHTPGKMTLSEKKAVFGTAKIIVGQYGGGMQNHYLCQAGTRLILLQSDKFQRDIFDYTCDMLGLSMVSVFGPATPCQNKIKFRNNSDFSIDPDLFSTALEGMLAEDNFQFLSGLSQRKSEPN